MGRKSRTQRMRFLPLIDNCTKTDNRVVEICSRKLGSVNFLEKKRFRKAALRKISGW